MSLKTTSTTTTTEPRVRRARGSVVALPPIPEAAPAVATETTDSFAIALRELVLEHDYTTGTGNPNWSAFSAELDEVHYETLRRAVAGERPPSPLLMEECARVLRVRPEYFLEYRVHLAKRDFDPREVGIDRAVQNLRTWASIRANRPAQ
jgi:hypothetical protein